MDLKTIDKSLENMEAIVAEMMKSVARCEENTIAALEIMAGKDSGYEKIKKIAKINKRYAIAVLNASGYSPQINLAYRNMIMKN